jgi:DmsE family decaheme c-type cytochrome
MTARSLWLALLLGMIGAAAAADEPVPMSDCAMCHEEEAPAFAAGPHGQAMARLSEQTLEGSCEACHGSATEHIDDPTPDNIVRAPGPDACITCHPSSESKLDLFAPAHVRQGVACLDCHASGHSSPGTDHLLKAQPRDLCSDCHQIERAQFRLPYAHRDGTHPFQCTNCHSLHGDNRAGRLLLAGGDGACLDCHFEKKGPFIFPHPSVERPGCVACHQPHGSPNPRLLTRHSVTMLCLECHADVPAFHDISRSRYQNCQNCHAAIHGSNRDPRLIEE